MKRHRWGAWPTLLVFILAAAGVATERPDLVGAAGICVGFLVIEAIENLERVLRPPPRQPVGTTVSTASTMTGKRWPWASGGLVGVVKGPEGPGGRLEE